MWNEIYADFLGGDICRVAMNEYSNPLQVLNRFLSGDMTTIKEVLGKLINYPNSNWGCYTIDEILKSTALPIAVGCAFEDYYRRSGARDPEPFGFDDRIERFKNRLNYEGWN